MSENSDEYISKLLEELGVTKYLKDEYIPKNNSKKDGTIVYSKCLKDEGSSGEMLYSDMDKARCRFSKNTLKVNKNSKKKMGQLKVGELGVVLEVENIDLIYKFNNTIDSIDKEEYKEFLELGSIMKELKG